MKKLTTLVQESEQDMLTEAASLSFQKELDELVNKYAEAIEEGLQSQLKSKISAALKNKSSNL